jgi:hypothetical protein
MARRRSANAVSIDFSGRDAAGNWFKQQPLGVSVTIAVRTALRVIPHIITDKNNDNFLSDIVLPMFYAMAVAWSVAKYPPRRKELAAASGSTLAPASRA